MDRGCSLSMLIKLWIQFSQKVKKIEMKEWLESLGIQEELLHYTYPKGKKIFVNQEICEGVMCILSGSIRVFATSSNFKEITLFSLKPQEICVLSASCVLPSFELDITLEAQEECQIALLPSKKAQKYSKENIHFSQRINEIISKRLSQTLQILNNIAFTPLPQRIKDFLLQSNQDVIFITHEELANHLGSSREVITRALKEMERKGEIALSRGKIIIKNL